VRAAYKREQTGEQSRSALVSEFLAMNLGCFAGLIS
jgi:hypothetical protein